MADYPGRAKFSASRSHAVAVVVARSAWRCSLWVCARELHPLTFR